MSSLFYKSPKVLSDSEFKAMQAMANSFAEEKVDKVLNDVERELGYVRGEAKWDREKAKSEIGKQIALAYAMGYFDKAEGKKLQKLYVGNSGKIV